MTSFTTTTTNYPQDSNSPIRRVKSPNAPITTKNFILGDEWLDTSSGEWWKLANNSSAPGLLWVRIGGNVGQVETLTGDTGGPVSPDDEANINIVGASGQIQVTGNPTTNTLTISLIGGSTAIDSIQVDAFTPPGTNPVVPTNLGLLTVTGNQVASGTVGSNVIRTDSLASNSFSIEVQRSTTAAATDSTKNGVSHFNSSDFTTDSSAFISLLNPFKSLVVVQQVFDSSGTYTKTANTQYAIAEAVGGGGGGGAANASGPNQCACGGGGGAGGYKRGVFSSASLGTSQTITIGAGGAGGNADNTDGSDGGDTSIGALMTAVGGGGGSFCLPGQSAAGDAGFGGSGGAGGTVSVAGQQGFVGIGLLTLDVGGGASVFGVPAGGGGGGSYFGGGVASNTVSADGNTSNGQGASSYGGGGGGGVNWHAATASGGNGFGGLVIITEFVKA